MSVIPLTVFFSLLLAGIFVMLFAREQRRRHLTSPERDSLLPLADEVPVLGGARASSFAEATDDRPRGLNLRGAQVPPSERDHACGCRGGARPPCAHCLRSRDEQDPAHF